MEKHDNHVHLNAEEASGASKEGVGRWVLLIGIVLAIGLLSVVWITGALSEGELEEEGDVAGMISATQDNGALAPDSIVGETEESIDPVVGDAPLISDETSEPEAPTGD